MITLSIKLTASEEEINGFAAKLGYKENETQTAAEFVTEKAREINANFIFQFSKDAIMKASDEKLIADLSAGIDHTKSLLEIEIK